MSTKNMEAYKSLVPQVIKSDIKPGKVISTILLTCIGFKVAYNFPKFTFYTPKDRTDLQVILRKFDAYYEPKENLTLLWHKLFTCKQTEDQNFGDYTIELRNKTIHLEFGVIKIFSNTFLFKA